MGRSMDTQVMKLCEVLEDGAKAKAHDRDD